jgi:ubiquinol-cytochrome c reductase cytochrome c1 subunit
MTMTIRALLAVALALLLSAGAQASEEGEGAPKHAEGQDWSWEGPFGKFDRQQLQRGYQVYKEVCAACHGMQFVAFRNLSQPGGPEFSDAQVKALAATFQFKTTNDNGEEIDRPGTAADHFPSPYPNEKAARAANGNALPPDLSVIAKAREGGPDYLYALLTGYGDPPAEFAGKMLPGLNFNPYFQGWQIAMPAPLTSDGQVTWPDGNPAATKQQMAKDVTAFLMWAAEPKMEERKELGVAVMIFLAALSILLYFTYKRVWRDVEH